jgi:hypothetical protein
MYSTGCLYELIHPNHSKEVEVAKITKKELIVLLNKDLGLEYTAMVQYTQHQGALKGAMYQSMQKELIIHAQEELAHATILSGQIDYLGGVPTVTMPPAKISRDNVTMLKQDLEGISWLLNRSTLWTSSRHWENNRLLFPQQKRKAQRCLSLLNRLPIGPPALHPEFFR